MKINQTRSRGRPLSFDREQVLEAATQVFWQQGYEGASIEGLTTAMGINPPSLYAKFGNKHTLFMHVLDHYVSTITSTQLSALMEKGDIRQAFSRYFEEIIQCVASPDLPSGCLIASVATEVSERDTIVRKKVRELLAKAEDLIAYRINQNKPENAPFKGLRSRQTARMVLAVGQSLAARARVGEPKARLRELADDFIDHLF